MSIEFLMSVGGDSLFFWLAVAASGILEQQTRSINIVENKLRSFALPNRFVPNFVLVTLSHKSPARMLMTLVLFALHSPSLAWLFFLFEAEKAT